MGKPKKIIVAPLNWGLGHATRCIPIIECLLNLNCEPVIASDGAALLLLKKEFPLLTSIELPSYDIKYPVKGKFFKLKILVNSLRIWRAIKSEQKTLNQIISEENIDLVISDNRLGLYSNKVKSIFITHQLKVLSGSTTWLSTKIHHTFIKKFSQCWVPDHSDSRLAGDLSQAKNESFKCVYIGPLSRFKKGSNSTKDIDLLIIISGPEPQRSILEKKLLEEAQKFNGKVLLIAGKVQEKQTVKTISNVTYCNYLTTAELQKAYNRSSTVLCRSGYSSVMDLEKLGLKAFFIPTPGQFEQEYLAQYLEKKQVAPYATQEDFEISLLDKLENYSGFEHHNSSITSMSSILETAFSSVKENSDPIPSSLST